jgi:hypothetical protein
LPPEKVVALWKAAYPRVFVDADEARAIGERFLRTYRDLLAAGLGNRESTPIEVVEREWAGALLVEVLLNKENTMGFRTVVKNDCQLELEFGAGVPGRKRRGLALEAARVLGYRVQSVDGD